MIEYAQLWSADPTAWRSAGAAWLDLASMAGQRAAEVSEAAVVLRSGWSGAAARAAEGRLAALRAGIQAGRPAFVEVDQVLAAYAAELLRARAMLDAAVRSAARANVLVDRHGGVSLDPCVPQLGPRSGAAVPRVAAEVRAALAVAAAADQEAACRLGELARAAAMGWAGQPPPVRPAAGADPGAVRRWWDGLTAAQRRWLLQHEPEFVGRLDGVPVGARDQANRLLLDARREELLSRREAVLGRRSELGPGASRGPWTRPDLARIERLLAGLDAIAARLTGNSQPRPYLLGLDATGDGRAIVALGDPDTADNVLTYVPGMTSDLSTVDGELGRAELMAARCRELEPADRTAAVLWLDYDAPDFLHEAWRESQATDAAPALHRFQEGLRATHDGPAARQSVLGHSYGSLVVGTAARDHGLAADTLVFLGSPGVGVEHAAALGVPPQHVWASTAANDIIRCAAAPTDVVTRLMLSPALPGLDVALGFGRPNDDLWFGHDPNDPAFGGRVFASDPHGHLGYWDADNRALDGVARIALGDQPDGAR